jgi:peptide/nickel transport system permease protein
MSSETADKTPDQGRTRGLIDRLRASPFLSELASNRLALAGGVIILAMVLVALYARLTIDLQGIVTSGFGTNPARSSPRRVGPRPAGTASATAATGREWSRTRR